MSLAQDLINRANALAAGKNGAGNVMPQEWLKVWQQTMAFNEQQAQKAHQLASEFARTRGRAMDEGEIEDLRRMIAAQSQAQAPVQTPVQTPQPVANMPMPSDAAPRPLGPQVANPWTGAATHQPTQSPWAGGRQPSRPMDRRTPNPWQINPSVWDSLGNMGQQLAVGFAEDEGWDAGDYVSQINATRPMGQAPRSVQTQYQMPRGWGR